MHVDVQGAPHDRIVTEIALHTRYLSLPRRPDKLESQPTRDAAEVCRRVMIDQQIHVSQAGRPAVCSPVPLPLAIRHVIGFESPGQTLEETIGRWFAGNHGRSGIRRQTSEHQWSAGDRSRS